MSIIQIVTEHRVLGSNLCVLRGFFAAMSVVDPEEGILKIFFVLSLLTETKTF